MNMSEYVNTTKNASSQSIEFVHTFSPYNGHFLIKNREIQYM